MISIEQGVRQDGALSADLYKVYVNPLLDILSNSGLGGKIGNINCCAPTSFLIFYMCLSVLPHFFVVGVDIPLFC
jgi:hypothetical protein